MALTIIRAEMKIKERDGEDNFIDYMVHLQFKQNIKYHQLNNN